MRRESQGQRQRGKLLGWVLLRGWGGPPWWNGTGALLLPLVGSLTRTRPPPLHILGLDASTCPITVPSRLRTLSPGFSYAEAHTPMPAPCLTPASGLCLVYGSTSRIGPRTMYRAPN